VYVPSVCTKCKITDDFNTILTHFMYLYCMFYTNIHAHSLRMTHKKGSKHIGALLFDL
jgi:hypothetical protein